MNEKNMKIDFSQVHYVTDCLKFLTNPERLKILCVLADRELNVQQIQQVTQIRQPTLSQQLTVLRKARIVSTRREGKHIFYSIGDAKIVTMIDTLYQLYCHPKA